MQTCTRCDQTKPLADFTRRAASPSGYTSACSACLRAAKQTDYWADEAARAQKVRQTVENKRLRFERDPAYKRAFNLWGSTKKRTRIPPWMRIADFVPVCKKALRKGPDYELDHIVPLKHPLVCGLHVPWNLRVVLRTTNARKRNTFAP